MKKKDIEVGQSYHRGCIVRTVVDEGAHLADELLDDKDCVRYTVVQGSWRSRRRLQVMTRRAFAQWAQGKLTEAQLEDVRRGRFEPAEEVRA